MQDIRLSECIAPHFYELHRDIREHRHTEYVLSGGRGSTKSSVVGLEFILLIKKNPKIHGLACRQVKDTLKDSVYAQLVWAIERLGLSGEFHCTRSPLEITYKPTGQKIYFRGADDPYKIKSIKAPFGYIGILWFEELDTFKGPEQIRNIEQSVMRGGSTFYEFKSFNPPRALNNWANEYVLEDKKSMLVHKSNYLTVPREWLGEYFFEEAEHLKEVNPKAYEHEYLGVPNGTGGAVFEYLELREITDEEIKEMDRIYEGVDWGYFPDYYSFMRVYYNPAQEKVYLLDEHCVNKASNRETAQWIIDKGYVEDVQCINCDSAEPKSVADYRDLGIWNAKSVQKGPGSVEYSMKWLQRRTIVIDKNRTPNAYKEFKEYEYERDKDGKIISGYPDANNHCIDAVRYSLAGVWKRRQSQA